MIRLRNLTTARSHPSTGPRLNGRIRAEAQRPVTIPTLAANSSLRRTRAKRTIAPTSPTSPSTAAISLPPPG